MIPSWVGAVLVGLIAAYYITKLGKTVTGSLCYAITTGTYAFMMTSGFVTHSVYLAECGMVTYLPLLPWLPLIIIIIINRARCLMAMWSGPRLTAL